MSLKLGKKQYERIADVLDQEHETVDDAVLAVATVTEQIFEERASFVVVGQLRSTRERSEIPPDDPEAIKLALGWYSTEGDARAAAESLWQNASTGEVFRVWILNTFHGTPAALHATRKAHYIALEEKQKDARETRLRESIEKYQEKSRQAVYDALSV